MKTRIDTLKAGVGVVCLGSVLAACGGGGGGGGSGDTKPPVVTTPVTVTNIEFAQTHVIPEAGLSWTTPNDSQSLHLVGGRDTVVLVALGQSTITNPSIEAWHNNAKLGSVALAAPAALAPTEGGGAPYATDRWSATVPGDWLRPGVSFKVTAANFAASTAQSPLVGLDSDLTLDIVPFYLFGATDDNTFPYATTSTPSAAQLRELVAKWPVAKIAVASLPRADWPRLVIPPREDAAGTLQPAYVINSMDQQKDGFASMSALLGVLGSMREANGDGATNHQYYAPLLPIDTGSGKYHGPGGGLGTVGGGASVGDYSYTGIFIHEVGHAFGLNHAGGAFDAGEYPYPAGSLKGSVWGYDSSKNQFMNVLVPSGANNFANCANSRQLDPNGRCYKQDPMQGGSGDQASGFIYSMFADFYAGKIQYWFEGTTTTDTSANRVYTGGRILVDKASATGYSRWDSIAKARVPVAADVTTNKGLYGEINRGLPIQTAVPVHAIAITMSYAGTAGATQIYPPFTRTGNLVRVFDPTVADDLKAIVPNTGTYPWYCMAGGCDYTVRVTYADGSKLHRVLEGGFRDWFKPSTAVSASRSVPTSGDSFTKWVINVPGAKAIQRVELLDTPMVWNGMPVNPTVLASR